MGALLPPVMGSMLELARGGETARRVYVSGDTLTGEHLTEISRRHPEIDVAVIHLGGTRVLLHTVTMDVAQGVDFLRRVAPRNAIGVHYDDYRVFRDPCSTLADHARESGFAGRIQLAERGRTLSLED